MTSKEANKEFRNVHAANEALKKYIESGRHIANIRSISNIDRYDVWQCVFEKEPKAYRELQIKELYNIVLKWENVSPATTSMFLITLLTQLTEFKSPLSLKDAVKIIVDAFGEDCLVVLKNEAIRSVKRRQEIIKPYFKKDNEWVNNSKKVVRALS